MSNAYFPKLVLAPSVPVWREGDEWIFDRKFLDGIGLYIRHWPGSVRLIMRLSCDEQPKFGLKRVAVGDSSFELMTLTGKERVGEAHLSDADIVVGSGDMADQLHLAGLARRMGTRCVYIIEYAPQTRHQIACLERPPGPRRWWSRLRLTLQEHARRKAFSLSDGLQVNGHAAWKQYRRFSIPHLYFDTRVEHADLISEEALEQRLSTLGQLRPLRLAFSGRLVRMKGVDHLIELARHLDASGVAFEMAIYGDGDMAPELQAQIDRYRLGSKVSLKGAVDFQQVLLPALRERTDLFVMLHRQSDPSCTYLETLSCGLPIVGYLNDAWAGLLEQSQAGWGVPMDDIKSAAERISALADHRESVADLARRARLFAADHDFETTFAKRVAHLLEVCGTQSPRPGDDG